MLGELNIYKKYLDPLKKFYPVLNCMAVIKRVDDHLRKSHHINSSHPDFHKYMNTAQIFDPSSIKIVDRSPCKPWGHDYAIINKQESWSSEEFHNVTANIVDKHTNVQLIKEKKNTLCNESIFINNHNLNQDVIEDVSSDFEADFKRNENSLVAPNELNSYMQSKSAILASNLFLFFEENDRIVTQAEYISMRDHLFVIIHFSNAHRSGVTANVTIAEFDRVVVAKDGKYLVSV